MVRAQSLRDNSSTSVEASFDDQSSYPQDLIRLQSARGDGYMFQDRVFDEFWKRGYAMERFEIDEVATTRHPGGSPFSDDHSRARIAVGAHRPRQTTGRSLMLQADVDVVPPGPYSLWSHPPFDPAIDGDWLCGREGIDMKVGHAANLHAMDALRRIRSQSAAAVDLQSVVEEEPTGNGALMTRLRG